MNFKHEITINKPFYRSKNCKKNPPTLDKNKTRDKLFANQRLDFPLQLRNARDVTQN